MMIIGFEQGSLHMRSGPRRPLGAALTWRSKARPGYHPREDTRTQCIRSLSPGPEGRGFLRITSKRFREDQTTGRDTVRLQPDDNGKYLRNPLKAVQAFLNRSGEGARNPTVPISPGSCERDFALLNKYPWS